MGPIAQKVLKELRKSRTREVVDLSALRNAKALLAELAEPVVDEDELQQVPLNVRLWLQAMQAFVPLGSMLLGLHALRKHAERVELADEEFMPGGPPQSPVLDSVFTAWWMADLSIGPRDETLCTILADLGSAFGLAPEMRELARALGRSHWGIYQAKRLGPERVQLTDLALGGVTTAQLADDCGTDGLWLARPFPSPVPSRNGDGAIVVTPYLLVGPDAAEAWAGYLGRVLKGAGPKERAAVIARHFKGAGDPRRVLAYITEGYAGVTPAGPIALTGVPDRPETLPHATSSGAAPTMEPTPPQSPLDALRLRLWKDVAASGTEHEAQHAARRARLVMDAPEAPVLARVNDELLRAYGTYGHLDREGRSVLERFDLETARLPPEQVRELARLRAGWCSAFEVRHIRLDEGLEVFDTLRRKKLWVTERSATRQLQLGDVVYGWILVDDERTTLEGALMHVPRPMVPAFVDTLKAVRDDLTRQLKGFDWRQRLGLLPPFALAILDALMSHRPPPTVVNHDGDDLLFSKAHYEVLDRARLLAVLAEHYESEGDGAFTRIDRDLQIAGLSVGARGLEVTCNSRERLASEKQALERVAQGLVRHRMDEHVDPLSAQARAQAKSRKPSPPPEIPPEALQAVAQMALAHMEKWIDEPIPALDGRTPREAARSERGRDTVRVMLHQQQQIFRNNPHTAQVDLSPIYASLGLPPAPPT